MEQILWGIMGLADDVEASILPALADEVVNGRIHAIATQGRSASLLRVKQRYSPEKVYYDYYQLLEDPRIDAIYIPFPMHVDWVMDALRAKKHVLCQKPIADAAQDVRRIQAAATANKVLAMEAYACMHSPVFSAMRALIAQGEIGRMSVVDAHYSKPLASSALSYVPNHHRPMHGSIYGAGCHNALALRQITRHEPVNAKAHIDCVHNGVEAAVNAWLDMDGGLTGNFRSSIISDRRYMLAASGDEGVLSFRQAPDAHGDICLHLSNHKHEKEIWLHTRNTYAIMLEQFTKHIWGEGSPVMPLQETEKNIRMLEMLTSSIAQSSPPQQSLLRTAN